jgi:RimJ/RimL family protein N-acetyltransferase
LASERSATKTLIPGARRWSPRSVLACALTVLREEGLRALWFRVLGETVYRRLRLVELRPEEAAQVESELALDFGFIQPAHAEDYARLQPGATAVSVRERLEHERCFGAWHNGRLISTRWIATGTTNVEYLGRMLALAPREAWISETFTHAAYRGHAVSGAAGAALARALAGEGIRVQLAGVFPENQLGLRAFEKAGYRPVGTIGYVRVGPWRRDFLRRTQLYCACARSRPSASSVSTASAARATIVSASSSGTKSDRT